jgi:NADH-quinone oxidoreductase subunit N
MQAAAMPGLDLRPAYPALILAVTGLVVLLAQAFTPRGKRAPSVPLSLFGLIAALVTTLSLASEPQRGMTLGGSLVADDLALFLHVVVLGVGILAVLLSSAYVRDVGMERGEYFTLLLFSMVGMLGLVSSRELIALFVALEIMSVAAYALCGLRRDDPRSQESALKYFVTGAFSSAFFLYGVALLYGATGTTTLSQVAARLAAAGPAGPSGLAVLGTALLLVGFGFKIASAPFHAWTPDVYEGAPTPVTAFMSAGVKAAAFGAFLRVFWEALPALSTEWQPAIAFLAMLTMVLGNLGALTQSNLKRMLAWSSVAHAGYLLVGLLAAPRIATEAVLFYLVGYAAVSLGTFGALAALSRGGREPLTLDDLRGLSDRRPALAAALTVFLVSLTGIPISAGFVGKFYLFSAAISAGQVGVAILGVLMSVVSAYYYLRVVVAMYMHERADSAEDWAPVSPAAFCALAVSVLVVLGLGVYPAPFLAFARRAALSLAL